MMMIFIIKYIMDNKVNKNKINRLKNRIKNNNYQMISKLTKKQI